MKKQELEKLRQPITGVLAKILVQHEEEDEFGYYATGLFRYKGKVVFVNLEEGRWHLSVSAKHTLGYYELKQIRYEFLPNNLCMAQIFPPREEFVNIHKNCFHLFQVES